MSTKIICYKSNVSDSSDEIYSINVTILEPGNIATYTILVGADTLFRLTVFRTILISSKGGTFFDCHMVHFLLPVYNLLMPVINRVQQTIINIDFNYCMKAFNTPMHIIQSHITSWKSQDTFALSLWEIIRFPTLTKVGNQEPETCFYGEKQSYLRHVTGCNGQPCASSGSRLHSQSLDSPGGYR